MAAPRADRASAALRDAALPLVGDARDYDRLLAAIGEARFVLIGEASHGTHEFYRERARITRRLIVECGFNAVAIEGDWPDAYRVDRFVRGQDDRSDAHADAALSGFRRFPTWMWRNRDVLAFVEWLRAHDEAVGDAPPEVGFYGLDLYSMHASMACVLSYLDRVDVVAAARARRRYGCFDQVGGGDPIAYGRATELGGEPSCEDAVVNQLVELHVQRLRLPRGDRAAAREWLFDAEQNARSVCNAEAYYREMFLSHARAWNRRDVHMMEMLGALADHLLRATGRAKIVVWAHNSHVGDARATERMAAGELNLGQLVREAHPDDCFSVGFSTWAGFVTAARDWDRPAERRRVRPALAGSHEALLHDVGLPAFQLDLARDDAVRPVLREPRLQRAIGVVYRPETERESHYFEARLVRQFDWPVHVDVSDAVVPLDHERAWRRDELPETYPFGT